MAGLFITTMPDQITYREIAPHEALSPYIDAYWTVTGENTACLPDKVLPDACVDIILNTGPAFITEQGNTLMNSGQAYLVGTMTRYKEMIRPPETRLIGIRFKPGAFSFFYDHSLLRDTADRTVEFDPSLLPDNLLHSEPPPLPYIPDQTRNLPDLLDRFFYQRLSASPHPVIPLINAVRQSKGKISVSDLAKRNYITIRHLERLFSLFLDITPKQFINFARYQHTLETIRHHLSLETIRHRQTLQPTPRIHAPKTLLDIAFECGYYDHAHLSNDIKKYSGSTPSHLDHTANF